MSTPRHSTPEPEPSGGDPPGTLILAIHGTLHLNEWVGAADEDDTLDEDAFSLVVKRTVAYGLGTFVREAPTSAQWAHNDAGGDWTQDGATRELAWLQVALPSAARQRIPIQPAARVLDDVLHRVGRFEFTDLHTVVPMDRATDGRAALAYAAGWFALADPASVRHFAVTLYAEPNCRLADHQTAILATAQELTAAVLEIEAAAVAQQPLGESNRPLAGEQETAAMVAAASYRCTAREWSLDIATWVAEVFVEALRVTGAETSVLLTVSIL